MFEEIASSTVAINRVVAVNSVEPTRKSIVQVKMLVQRQENRKREYETRSAIRL